MRKFLHNKNSKILIITLVILTVMSVFSHNGSNIFSGAVNTVTKGLSTLTAGAASSNKSKEELEKEIDRIENLDEENRKTKEKIQIITTYGRGLSDEYKRFLQRTDERVFV